MSRLLAIALLLAACAPGTSRWVGENIHAVDGYWVDTETPCLPGGADCTVEVKEALRALPPADAERVVGAALAGYPSGYIDASGTTILMATAGLSQARIVVLDLADGQRRIVTLLCYGPISTGRGFIVEPQTCAPVNFQHLHVDRQPGRSHFGP